MATVLRMSNKYPRKSNAGTTTSSEGISSLLVPMSAVNPTATSMYSDHWKNRSALPEPGTALLAVRLRLRVDTTLFSLNSALEQSAIRAPVTERNPYFRFALNRLQNLL